MKHMIKKILFLIFLMGIGGIGMGQSSHELLMEGDALYKKEQYDLAEEKYRKAKLKDKSGKAAYNLGNSLSVQERYEEAANQFSNAAAMSNDPEVKSKAYYNLGNTHFRNQKFKESIDAYKTALSYNEEDSNAKENLMMAKKMLQVQEQQKQQQQQEQEQQENQEQQEQEQQQQEQEQQQQQQNQDQSQEEQEKQQQTAEETEKKDLDKEDARKLLEIIDNEEKKVQEKLRKMKGNSSKPKKDW